MFVNPVFSAIPRSRTRRQIVQLVQRDTRSSCAMSFHLNPNVLKYWKQSQSDTNRSGEFNWYSARWEQFGVFLISSSFSSRHQLWNKILKLIATSAISFSRSFTNSWTFSTNLAANSKRLMTHSTNCREILFSSSSQTFNKLTMSAKHSLRFCSRAAKLFPGF